MTKREISLNEANEDFIGEATLMDDWFMTLFFQDSIPETEEVLRIILDNKDLKVTKVETQRPISGSGRSVRLDIHAYDSEGGQHDIEIQKSSGGAGKKRARYHSSMMDSVSLKKGEDFEKLPETHVIFITNFDVLGGNRPIYHINRTIDETGEEFGDKAHIIYVNGADKDNTTELGRLMQDFSENSADKMNSSVLKKHMKDIKEDNDMKLYELYLIQETEKAEKLGVEKKEKAIIRTMLEKGKTVEEIHELLDIPVNKILKVKEEEDVFV